MDVDKLVLDGRVVFEMVIRKKASKEVVYKGDMVGHSMHRRIYGCKNDGDESYAEVLPEPRWSINAMFEDKAAMKEFEAKISKYSRIEPLG